MLRYGLAETRRFLKNRYTYVSFLVVLAFSIVFSVGFAINYNTVFGPTGQNIRMGTGTPSWFAVCGLFIAYSQLGIIFILILNILIVLYYREWKGGVIGHTIATGLSRTKLYFAKYIHAAITTALVLLLYFVIHTGLLTALLKTSTMVGYYPDIWRLYLHVLLYYLAFLAMLHGLTFMTRGGFTPIILGITLATFIVETLLFTILRFIRSIGPWTGEQIANFFKQFSLQTAFFNVIVLRTGIPFDEIMPGAADVMSFEHGVYILLGRTIVYLLIGYLVFRHRAIDE